MKGNTFPLIMFQVNVFSVNTINIIVTADSISAEAEMRKARQNELGLRVKISCNHEYVRFHRKQ
jgi:hypothetical protein